MMHLDNIITSRINIILISFTLTFHVKSNDQMHNKIKVKKVNVWEGILHTSKTYIQSILGNTFSNTQMWPK